MTILGKLNEAKPYDWDKLKGLCPDEDSKVDSIFNGRHTARATPCRNEQVGGDHYKNSMHQPLEIVLDTEGYEAFKGACLTKVYKYLQRRKSDRLKDYKKAQHILNWLVEETQQLADEERQWEKDNGIY